MVKVVALFCCCIAVLVKAQQDYNCHVVSQCMTEAQAKFEQCQAMLGVPMATNSSSQGPSHIEIRNQCEEEARALIEQKNQASADRSAQYAECINRRLTLSYANELDPKKKDECKGLVDTYQRDRATRQKRQTTKSQVDKMKEFRDCMTLQNKMKDQCTPLTECCSEAAVCAEEYEQSDVHDRIHGLTEDIILKRRECKQMKEQSSSLLTSVSNSDIVPGNQITKT